MLFRMYVRFAENNDLNYSILNYQDGDETGIKDVSIEMRPVIRRKIISLGKKMKKDIFVATNFLESMLENNYPTRGEVNDIYNTLELGAKGLVLASETAIGKFPVECVGFLKKIIKTFNQYH